MRRWQELSSVRLGVAGGKHSTLLCISLEPFLSRIRDSRHPMCLCSSKSIIIFAYLNLLLTLIFREDVAYGRTVFRVWGSSCRRIPELLCCCGVVCTEWRAVTVHQLWLLLLRTGRMCCCAGCLLLFRKLHQVSKNICFSHWFLCSHLGRCGIIAPTR